MPHHAILGLVEVMPAEQLSYFLNGKHSFHPRDDWKMAQDFAGTECLTSLFALHFGQTDASTRFPRNNMQFRGQQCIVSYTRPSFLSCELPPFHNRATCSPAVE